MATFSLFLAKTTTSMDYITDTFIYNTVLLYTMVKSQYDAAERIKTAMEIERLVAQSRWRGHKG